MKSPMNRLASLLSPFGRIGQKTFWIAMPILVVLRLALSFIGEWTSLSLVMLLVVSLPLSWLSFTVLIKRLHDFGMDALGLYLAWAAVLLGLMVVGAVANMAMGVPWETVGLVSGVVQYLGWLAVLVWAGLQAGSPFPNSHGRGGSAGDASRPERPATGYLTL